MRWGARSASPGALSWVRPLHSIVATFGPETEEPVIVPLDIDGIKSGDETRGHRFMAPAAFKVRRFDDYVAKLEQAKKADPRTSTLLALAGALGVRPGSLLDDLLPPGKAGGDGEEQPDKKAGKKK